VPSHGGLGEASNVEIADTPTNSSWLNRIEARFTALRYFTRDGTDHAGRKEQRSMIRRYIIRQNRHADDQRLREVVGRPTSPEAAGQAGSKISCLVSVERTGEHSMRSITADR
jgi:hypothetical protein